MESWTRGPVDLGAFLSAPGAARCRRARENSMILHRGLAANVDVVRSPLGAFLSAPGTAGFRRAPQNWTRVHESTTP